MDVQQGNVLTEADVTKIVAGMPKSQVIQLLGQPLLNPAFSESRWDYAFFQKKAYEDEERKLLSVFFDGERVSRVEKAAGSK